ncbi:haloacid dehalogenase type II [Nocardioides panaciterrulae]|uniref:2-haloacid dehalogenase n=1 Tax=Nocardioides panaciterrulae TaxID=661492 RepID=A0A7Y9E504_9ACTN|nr:haloacid dehalogenase type II [Nocardioides panaciterrulae]NYD41174.1 2-haloacid dehalogenase [Nocardioides panaciterrulae]
MTTTVPRPAVLLLDVNETVSDLGPMEDRFAEVGAPPALAGTWFAGVLRDGFALAVAGVSAPFARIGADCLRGHLAGLTLDRPLEEAVEHVMSSFTSLDVHPDVRSGLPDLAAAGLRVATLSNGAATVARQLLGSAGLDGHVEAMLSVEDAGVWKPAPAAYAYGCDVMGVAPADAMLVAVHPWDLDGAARAGLRTCWVDRTGTPYPSYFRKPDLVVSGFDDLARQFGPARL